MNILLFGGSFNPPHLGHMIVIQQAFELIPHIGELWLLPCHNHTFNKSLAPASHRLAMCRLLINRLTDLPNNQIKLCSLETDKKLSGSTYETLQLLKKIYPQHTFSFLIGSDQLPVFTKWHHYQKLLEAMTFYVYPRASFPLKPLFPKMIPLTSPTQIITNINSTLIRQRLAQDMPVDFLLPPSLETYLTKHSLYSKTVVV